jgi:hypothetical protein
VGDPQSQDGNDSARGIDNRGTANRGTGAPSATPGKPVTTAPAKPSTPVAAPAVVRDIRLHFYLPIPGGKTAFVEYLDYSWDKTGIGPFTAVGTSLSLLTDESKGIAELKRSLSSSGVVAVYMGHTSLVEKKKGTYVAQGLAPQGAKKRILTNGALVSLLKKANANLVILAGCATDASVPSRLKNNVVVITTASGRDGVTHSAFWARALTGLLLALVGWEFDGKTVTQRLGGTASVREAMDIGNKFFPSGDSFVLASGDGSIRVF